MKTGLKFCIIIGLFIFISACQNPYAEIDKVIETAIENHITPGASIIIGTTEKIVYHSAYGHFTYDENSTIIDTNSIFDMASLTKPLATTMCAIKLYDDGLLDIDKPVADYIPEFAQNGKEDVLVRHLLLHSSGLAPYYSPKPEQSPDEIIDTIYGLKLRTPAGTKYRYSCLNFVTMMKVIEAVAGKPMWQYYKETWTEPLNMKRTMFCPPDSLKSQCVTTQNPQGDVHDPLAYGLKGYSGNAGLFTTTGDMAKFCQLLLGKGEYKGNRYLSEETVTFFTTQYDTSSYRTLGWGTNLLDASTSGSLLSPTAYGHLGYTGTTVWCDPVQDIFILLFTNRVYPDDTAKPYNMMSAVADESVKAMKYLGLIK